MAALPVFLIVIQKQRRRSMRLQQQNIRTSLTVDTLAAAFYVDFLNAA
jgi:hypothetical protein